MLSLQKAPEDGCGSHEQLLSYRCTKRQASPHRASTMVPLNRAEKNGVCKTDSQTIAVDGLGTPRELPYSRKGLLHHTIERGARKHAKG